jgi:hypothetical protein
MDGIPFPWTEGTQRSRTSILAYLCVRHSSVSEALLDDRTIDGNIPALRI